MHMSTPGQFPYVVALFQQSLDVRFVADHEFGQVLHVDADAGVLAQLELFARGVEEVIHNLGRVVCA